MKKKIGTMVDEALFRRLRVHAAQRGKSISGLIEESISSYLALNDGSADERVAAVERFVSRPFQLSRSQLELIMEEDPLDQ